MALRNLLVRVGADLSDFEKGMRKAGKQLGEFQKKVQGFRSGVASAVGGVFAGLGAGLLLKGGIEDAVKYEALMDTLGQTMGESRNDFEKWQRTVGASMGLSKLQGSEMANTLSLNFKKIAVDSKDLVQKTTKMMELATVIANKRGMTMQEVSDRIRSAMNQEADGADELGVNVRIAAIQQSKAYQEMANGQPWDKLSENMRKTILYHHILEQVSTNLGTTIRDNTQLRVTQFTASLYDVRLALGQAFLPILHTVLPLLTAFARKIEVVLQYITAFVRAIFGYKSATKTANENTQATNEQAEAIGGLGDSAEDTAGKIAKAGKEAKRGLAGFDEIHQLAEKPASGGGAGDKEGAGAGGGITAPDTGLGLFEPPDFSAYEQVSEEIENLAKKFKKFFKESEGIRAIKEGFEDIADSIRNLIEKSGLDKLMVAIGKDLPNFFDNLGQIAGGILSAIAGSIDLIVALVYGDWATAFRGLEKIWWGLQDVFNGTIGTLFPRWGKSLDEATANAKIKWGEFKALFTGTNTELGTSMELLKARIIARLREAVEQSIIDIKARRQYWADTISWVWSTTVKGFKDLFTPLWTWLKENVIDRTVNGFNNTFLPIYDRIKEKVEALKKTFSGITSAFDKGFGAGVEYLLNGAISRINSMISGLNNVKDKIPFGNKIPDVPKIPKLAKGGIVSSPTIAMVGEAGTEAITPIDKLQGMISTAVLTAMQFNRGNQASGDIVLNLDGKQFARIVKPLLDRENVRIGNTVKLNPI